MYIYLNKPIRNTTVTVHTDDSTPKGHNILSELEKNKDVVIADNILPVDENEHPIKTYSSDEIEDMVWDKLSDHCRICVHKL